MIRSTRERRLWHFPYVLSLSCPVAFLSLSDVEIDAALGENPNTMNDFRWGSLSYLLRRDSAVRLMVLMKTCWLAFTKKSHLRGSSWIVTLVSSFPVQLKSPLLVLITWTIQRGPSCWIVFAFHDSLRAPCIVTV